MTTNRRGRTLYRDPSDKMIGGVCSGLGHYFDVDTVLVRVGFVVVALLGGGGALAYLILWAILDPAPPGALEGPNLAEPPAIDVDTIAERASLEDERGSEPPAIDVDTIADRASLEDESESTPEAPPHEELRIDEP